jgi:DNA-binding IclR family transcriptional regulator
VGGRAPALCTATGKAILAHCEPGTREAALAAGIPRLTPRTLVNPAIVRAALERFTASGIAEDTEGTVLGAHCVAAPVFADGSGFAAAAVSMSFPAGAHISATAIARLLQSAALIGTHC